MALNGRAVQIRYVAVVLEGLNEIAERHVEPESGACSVHLDEHKHSQIRCLSDSLLKVASSEHRKVVIAMLNYQRLRSARGGSRAIHDGGIRVDCQ